MPIYSLYHMWFEYIQQLFPGLRLTQQRNLGWLIVGIYQSRSVHLSKVAGKIPGTATVMSLSRRLSRWLDNPAIQVRPLYEPIARQLLACQAQTGEIRLIIDGTKIGFGHQLLMLAIAYRKRALPIAWTWIRSRQGHSSARKQVALLAYVRHLLPSRVPVVVVGDTEFEAGAVQQHLEDWGWTYVLRQKPNNQVSLRVQQAWQPCSDLAGRPGTSRWEEGARLTRTHARCVNILAHWEFGEKAPWVLATNLRCRTATLRAYRRRMWIEEVFGDLKQHGVDLESTHMRHVLRLSRLTLAVVLLYLWLVTSGVRAIKAGLRALVDRADRRDLSIFQIGWRFVERRLINALCISIRLCPGYS